jgi:hypothetical protein
MWAVIASRMWVVNGGTSQRVEHTTTSTMAATVGLVPEAHEIIDGEIFVALATSFEFAQRVVIKVREVEPY